MPIVRSHLENAVTETTVGERKPQRTDKCVLLCVVYVTLNSARDQRNSRQSSRTVLGHRTHRSRSVAVHHEQTRICMWSYTLWRHH